MAWPRVYPVTRIVLRVFPNQKTAVCSVARIQRKLDRDPAHLKSFLCSPEIRYCSVKKYPAEPAAARWAAKRALLGVLKIPVARQMPWMREIQIAKKPDGAPFFKFSIRFKKKFRKFLAQKQILLSLAHERKLAVAWVWVCEI